MKSNNSNTSNKLSWAYYRPDVGSITIYASKLAACVGMHQYAQPQSELRDEFLRHIGAVGHEDYSTTQEQEAAALSRSLAGLEATRQSEVLSLLQSAYERSGEVATALVAAREALATINNTTDNTTDLEKAMSCVRTRLFTQHGAQKEDQARQMFEKVQGRPIRTSSTFVVSQKPLFVTRGGVRVFLGGKHDGLTEDGRLIEIKTRLRRFLGTPKYELVQVHAYMHIFEKDTAMLIEQYDSQQRTHEVIFDQGIWSDVVLKLAQFLDDLFEAADKTA